MFDSVQLDVRSQCLGEGALFKVADLVRGSLTSLSPRKQSILGLRFGLIDGLPKTLVEIATALGLSSERVRQIQVEALSELRGGPAAERLEDALPIR